MKIFSLLLLQCKKKACRMINYLVPSGCAVTVRAREPSSQDFQFMEAQLDTICAMDLNSNQFILPVILEELRRVCRIDETVGVLPSIQPEEMQKILEANSLEAVLGEERMHELFNVLFGTELDEGALVCTNCNCEYIISNNIVDFVQAEGEV
ncbi:multifunctional methyltransferase subunit TRM112 [Nematocida major]|uniref:multifunctional methyltransferase subunit TRM112 n=1 Tax=Nematocida major TaxID=1912982 RepID=UPI0020089130|nr:multifunctional methyltransferase subunit TRM112 [Nematocida major]KAH9385194.1 multifunctional methyltransferase subunit TRM112 [Nematocida major]